MTEIKASDAGNVLIMPKKAGPVCERNRVFNVSENGGAVLVNCTNPFRSGKIDIKLSSPPEAPVTCAFAGSKNAQEFDIPTGVDSLELIYADQQLRLRYDAPSAQTAPKPEPAPPPKLEPISKPRPFTRPDPKPKPSPKPAPKTGNAFAQLQEAFSRAIEEASKIDTNNGDNEQVIVIRQQITEKMLEPYRSSDRKKETILAEELLQITRHIISELIEQEQEKADNSTLPK